MPVFKIIEMVCFITDTNSRCIFTEISLVLNDVENNDL